MIVLGIDPGTATTGYGVVEGVGSRLKAIKYGSIITPSTMELPERLSVIHRELSLLIEECRPKEAAIESLFFNDNAKTALSVGQARGVAMLACFNSNLVIAEYTPLQVKMAMTGYGRADKKQIIAMTRMLLNLEKDPKPDDTADALAIAICHINSRALGSKNMVIK